MELYPLFGVEAELDYRIRSTMTGWQVKSDGSLRQRATPPTSLKRKTATLQVESGTCEVVMATPVDTDTYLTEMNDSIGWVLQDCNASCGMHHHIGLGRDGATLNLAWYAAKDENVKKTVLQCDAALTYFIDRCDHERNNSTYAVPVSSSNERRVPGTQLYYRGGGNRFSSSLGLQDRAYSSVVARPGLGSIEFRSPSPRLPRRELGDTMATIAADIIQAVNKSLLHNTYKKEHS